MVTTCAHGEDYERGRRDGGLPNPPPPKPLGGDIEQPCTICGGTKLSNYDLGLSDAKLASTTR